MKVNCKICGKEFNLKPRENLPNGNCCSYECSKVDRSIRMSGKGKHQYGLKGDKNSSWKSDRYITRYGYIQTRAIGHPFAQKGDWVLEHRLIAEQYLLDDNNSIEINEKKYLKKEYIVHHKNGDRLDNRVENLEVMTREEHSKMHSSAFEMNRDELTGRYIPLDRNYPLVKVKIEKGGAKPRKAHNTDAGLDIVTPIKFTVPARDSYTVGTKVHMQLPIGYVGFLKSKSGLNVNHGITSDGTIDANYNGEIKVKLYNHSNEDHTFEVGDKITQMVILKIPEVELVEVEKFDETERGICGFGSTGV